MSIGIQRYSRTIYPCPRHYLWLDILSSLALPLARRLLGHFFLFAVFIFSSTSLQVFLDDLVRDLAFLLDSVVRFPPVWFQDVFDLAFRPELESLPYFLFLQDGTGLLRMPSRIRQSCVAISQ